MKTVVFFKGLDKLHDALGYFDMESFSNRRVPVKVHMGEVKNKYYSKPFYSKPFPVLLNYDLVTAAR